MRMRFHRAGNSLSVPLKRSRRVIIDNHLPRIVVAMDSFKGSLDAASACEAVRDGILRVIPDCQIVCLPIADGGEGTAQTMLRALGGEWRRRRVCGPLPEQTVSAGFAWIGSASLAVVEMASAAGLPLVPPNQRNPECTTTRGVGQLIRSACRLHPQRLLLSLGGSATVDGGVGMATELGWRFLDVRGRPIGWGGAALYKLHAIEGAPLVALPRVEALCDVTNPLIGPRGAARVFGPQKGADPAMVRRLEKGLERLADIIRRDLGVSVADLPGAGAAGGLGAAAVVFLGARLRRGIEAVLEAVRLEDHLKDAEWVLTGEGCFDLTSLEGKAVSGVVAAAARYGARVAVLAGRVRLSRARWKSAGIQMVYSLASADSEVAKCMDGAAEYLSRAAQRWAENAFVKSDRSPRSP